MMAMIFPSFKSVGQMTTDDIKTATALPNAAKRALAEADARRRAQKPSPAAPPEVGGRKGPDPARFGDWEKNGIISDF